jgi:superfamily I DNA/RNA helicase
LTVRPPDQGRHAAGLQDYLLDSLQEMAVKGDLDLPPEQARVSRDFHISIVNGVAGSGKTLILLYRLRLLHSLFPDKRFLVLTHNRPLIRDMQSRYKQLVGDSPRSISWETFNGFCRRYWPEAGDTPWVDPIGKASRDRLIQSVWDKYFSNTSIPPESLESELDWYKDQIPMDKSTYLQAERKGRGFRLNQEQRQKMWEAMTEYQNQLKARNGMDWGDVPRRFWRFVQDGKVELPVYEFVMIDEAQFFAPIWFDIIRRVVKPRSGSIFIVADPTQGFLGRGSSWKSLGFDARGKTQHIRRSYRTTHEILNFATLLYRTRVTKRDLEEDVIEPDLLNMPHGMLPILVPARSGQDEIGIVTAEVEALCKKGYSLHNVLVLHADWEGVDALIASLNRHLGEGKAIDPKEALPGDCVRVTTLNAGTGLESQIVFLVGLNRLFEREQSLRLAEDEVERLILENTRKIYMAATRAGQRLVITYVGDIPGILIGLLSKPST